MKSKKIIVNLLLNNFTQDNRVLKELTSLSTKYPGHDFFLFALHSPHIKKVERITKNAITVRIALKTKPFPNYLQFIKYFEWGFSIKNRIKDRSVSVIHCHDFNTLLLGVILKKIKSSKLVYDAHELESEVHGLKGLTKLLVKALEYLLIPFVDTMITTSSSTQNWYQKRFPKTPVHLVRNIPKFEGTPFKSQLFRDTFKIPSDEPIFLYQGLLSTARGVDKLLDIFTNRLDKKHLVLMGNGPLQEKIIAIASTSPTIHFHPAVPMKILGNYTNSAEIGFTILEETCLNHRFALPNKLFEYILSKTLVIGSNFPDVQTIIQHYNCGWAVAPYKDAISNLINQLTPIEIFKKKEALEHKLIDLSWDNEANILTQIYQEYL